jgi:hypothetical protein
MIQIKSLFSDWKTVTREEAERCVRRLFNDITAMSYNEKLDYINKNRLRGITAEELLELDFKND